MSALGFGHLDETEYPFTLLLFLVYACTALINLASCHADRVAAGTRSSESSQRAKRS